FPSQVEPPAGDPQVARGPGQPCASGKDATVWRLLPGVGVVEALGTGPFLRAGGGRRSCRCALVACGRAVGNQPSVRARQRTGHRTALVPIDGAGRLAGGGRSQDQRHALISLPGSHSAAQDQTGAASPGSLTGSCSEPSSTCCSTS